MTFKKVSAVLAVMVFMGGILSHSAQGTEGSAQNLPTKPVAVIDGFRSAKFGQTEAEVREAIASDFGKKASALKSENNPIEGTTVLSVDVESLLPNSGEANIAYVLGYTSRKLIQVNVLWQSKGKNDPTQIALALSNYFLGEEFKADSVVVNAELPNHSVLVFRGADAKGRMVVLELLQPQDETKAKKADNSSKQPAAQPSSLRLSYIEKPAEPDIFKIKPGQF